MHKLPFGKFGHVRLARQEHDTLFADYPDTAQAAIDKLDAWIGAKGDRYRSHYMALHSWALRAVDEEAARQRAPARARLPDDGMTDLDRMLRDQGIDPKTGARLQ